jgi:hypothetical protein
MHRRHTRTEVRRLVSHDWHAMRTGIAPCRSFYCNVGGSISSQRGFTRSVCLFPTPVTDMSAFKIRNTVSSERLTFLVLWVCAAYLSGCHSIYPRQDYALWRPMYLGVFAGFLTDEIIFSLTQPTSVGRCAQGDYPT